MFGSYFGMPSAYQMLMKSPFTGDGNSDQVKTGPVQRTPPMAGGLLGGPMSFGSYQSPNPWGSQSAGLFDQYMNQQMRMYPGGFFGFQAPAFAQPPAPAPAPSNQTAMENMLRWWQDMGYDRGGTAGGGN